MRLLKALVQNYRAIVDSGVVDIQDRVTVLIGKNEQGKTTFLKALASSNSGVSYRPSDLPNHLRVELEQKKASEIPIVTLWLQPEAPEIAELTRLLKTVDDASIFKCTKYYDGSRQFAVVSPKGTEQPLQFSPPNFQAQVAKFRALAQALNEKLTAHAERHADFKPHLESAQAQIKQFSEAKFGDPTQINNIIQTFATALTAVPGQDSAIQADVAGTTKEIENTHNEIRQLLKNDPRPAFEQLLPLFIFHSTSVDKIPNDVSVVDFVKDPDVHSRGMANLCRVAGLSMQRFKKWPTQQTMQPGKVTRIIIRKTSQVELTNIGLKRPIKFTSSLKKTRCLFPLATTHTARAFRLWTGAMVFNGTYPSMRRC